MTQGRQSKNLKYLSQNSRKKGHREWDKSDISRENNGPKFSRTVNNIASFISTDCRNPKQNNLHKTSCTEKNRRAIKSNNKMKLQLIKTCGT